MAIHTVLGPIEPDQLGPTSMHEHLLSDLSIWSKPSAEPVPEHDALHLGMTGYLRWNALAVPENLVLHDPDVAIAELAAVRGGGGSAVVELTLEGMGRRIEELPRISRESGVHVCAWGAEWYVEELHPARLAGLDVDTLTGELPLRAGARHRRERHPTGTDRRDRLQPPAARGGG